MIKWQRDIILDALYYYKQSDYMRGKEKSIDKTIITFKDEVNEYKED